MFQLQTIGYDNFLGSVICSERKYKKLPVALNNNHGCTTVIHVTKIMILLQGKSIFSERKEVTDKLLQAHHPVTGFSCCESGTHNVEKCNVLYRKW